MGWREELQKRFAVEAEDWMNLGFCESENVQAVGHGFNVMVDIRRCKRGKFDLIGVFDEFLCMSFEVWEDWL